MSVAYELPDSPGTPRGRFSAFVRPAPPLEPPYDPLDGRTPLTVVPPLAPHLPFEEAAPRKTELGNDFWGPQPTGRRSLRDPRPLAHQFLQATLEMLHGRRPPQQLQKWTSPAVFHDLLRARQAVPATRSRPPSVQSVHVSEPADGVAEVCAVIRRGERRHAVAARLEGIDGQWRCVKLQIG